MNKDFKIDFAEPKHLDEILYLGNQTFIEHRQRQPEYFRDDGKRMTREKARVGKSFPKKWGALPAKSKSILVATRGDTVLGYVDFMKIPNGFQGSDLGGWIWILDISVRGSERGKGIGSALLNTLAELAKDEGYAAIDADIWDGNDASITLFEKRGFAPKSRAVRRIIAEDQMRFTPPKSGMKSKLSQKRAFFFAVLAVMALVAYLTR